MKKLSRGTGRIDLDQIYVVKFKTREEEIVIKCEFFLKNVEETDISEYFCEKKLQKALGKPLGPILRQLSFLKRQSLRKKSVIGRSWKSSGAIKINLAKQKLFKTY